MSEAKLRRPCEATSKSEGHLNNTTLTKETMQQRHTCLQRATPLQLQNYKI